jgi:DNA-binding response OmpR family regulator
MARILVIDDDALFTALMRRALEQRGHHVATAGDAKSGRERLKDDVFDALVCDILLPDETGLHILRDARKATPLVALVAISGGRPGGRGPQHDVLHLAQTLGVDAIVKKPFELSNFVATVEGAMTKKRRTASAAGA